MRFGILAILGAAVSAVIDSRVESMKRAGTPGGNRLRALREARGRTQLEVELDAYLGIGYLQRVESGKVRYPERDTLERILTALDAHYTARCDVLEMFGYLVDTPLPDEAEIRWAVEICRAELADAVFPVYLLDCAHHLLAWNDFVPSILGSVTGKPGKRLSMLRILFDPAFGVTGRIANADEFFPAQIRALRYQMRLFRGENWYTTLIDDLRRGCPLFERWWNVPDVDAQIAARPLIPLVIMGVTQTPEPLRFRLTSEPFAQDRRFRIIYYIPADPATMRQYAAWANR